MKTSLKLTLQISFYIAIFLFFATPAKAATNDEIIRQQDWISRNSQDILQEKKRDDEIKNIAKERQLLKKKQQEDAQPEVINNSAICFTIKEIELLDATLISSSKQQELVSEFIGQCMDAKLLAAVMQKINSFYHQKGYITTQLVVVPQNLADGVFKLRVIEGKIEKINLGKNHFGNWMQKFTAFGNIEGELLNVNDINQGIYQINRLQSNAALMKILPGSEIGLSKIDIENQQQFPVHFNAGYDNLGNKFTGIFRNNFSTSFDNLLFLNDNLNLNYSANLHDKNHVKDIESISGSLTIPYKYSTFSYDHSHSNFNGQNQGQNFISNLSGFSKSSKFSADHVFLSLLNLRISAGASLITKESASYLNGEKIENSQRKLSIANGNLTISSFINDDISLYIKPSYARGLKILNAKKDLQNQASEIPKAQFQAFKLYMNFSKKFSLPKINAPIFFISEFDSQYSKNTLFGSEQFSVGGYYSVRGFRENFITGDSGYYLRNKLVFNLSSMLSPFVASEFLSHLNKFKFEPFYDYGQVRNAFDSSSGRLSGAGIKGIFSSKYFTASATYSSAISKSQLISSNEKENKMIYFEISLGNF